MKFIPIYTYPKDSGGDPVETPIYCRIYHPSTDTMWDFETKKPITAEEIEEQSNDPSIDVVERDTVFDMYRIYVPDKLPGETEYEILTYQDAELKQLFYGCKVYLDNIKGWIHPEKTHGMEAL